MVSPSIRRRTAAGPSTIPPLHLQPPHPHPHSPPSPSSASVPPPSTLATAPAHPSIPSLSTAARRLAVARSPHQSPRSPATSLDFHPLYPEAPAEPLPPP